MSAEPLVFTSNSSKIQDLPIVTNPIITPLPTTRRPTQTHRTLTGWNERTISGSSLQFKTQGRSWWRKVRWYITEDWCWRTIKLDRWYNPGYRVVSRRPNCRWIKNTRHLNRSITVRTSKWGDWWALRSDKSMKSAKSQTRTTMSATMTTKKSRTLKWWNQAN